jgi:hypothetical protein
MDISLIHAGLAAGTALAALPVILHLFMKQTPKHVIFPALRLIRERQKRSRKKLRVKNWLLLLARMALVALMALALARPRLFSQTSLGDQEVPTALGLVFDTSLSMGYKPRDKTLLDEAKERAYDILKKLPDSSQVFVIDSADAGPGVAMSPAAARKRIASLTLRAANRHLNGALGQAYTAVADCDRPRHEVYVLTDLARSSWDVDRPVEGLAKIKKVKTGVVTYVLRLSPKDVRDVAVVEASPSTSVATQSEPVEIKVKIRAKGPAAGRTVTFYLDSVLRQKKQLELADGGEAEVKFTTPKLDPVVSLHQGYVRLGGAPDPLDFDDTCYFTFKVRPALKVLLVSDRPLDAKYVADALDPNPAARAAGTPRPFHVDTITSARFAEQPRDALKEYSSVFLLNVADVAGSEWSRLNSFVREGGGLVVGLGDLCKAESYNRPGAAQLLPASLEKIGPRVETTFGNAKDLTHPLFSKYPRPLDALLSQVPIYKFWTVKVPKGSRALLNYASGEPALVERSFQGIKTGRVLLWTTPLARRADTHSTAAWNEFALPFSDNWSFYFLMNQTVPYLAGASSETLNYEAGQDVILPIDPTRRFKNYIISSADGKTTERQSPPVTSDSLVIVSPQPIGQWTVTASGPAGERLTEGFSVNPPVEEMQSLGLEPRDLDALFGKDGYKLATDAESLKRVVNTGRVGFEIFPWLMMLILILVTLENLLANKFYRETARTPAVGAAT